MQRKEMRTQHNSLQPTLRWRRKGLLRERKYIKEIVEAINYWESKEVTKEDICGHIQCTFKKISYEPNWEDRIQQSLSRKEFFIRDGKSRGKGKPPYWLIREDFKDLIELEFGTSKYNYSSLIEKAFDTKKKMELSLEEIIDSLKSIFESINEKTESYWVRSIHFELSKSEKYDKVLTYPDIRSSY